MVDKDQHDMPPRGYAPSRRPRWGMIALIVLGHLALGLLLARLLAPQFTQQMISRASEGLTVIVTTPPPTPEPRPEPDAGPAGAPAREAVAKPQQAPANPLASPSPVPRASATGTDSQSGASEQGAGTGNSGAGEGTGSGNGGSGRGGGIAVGPSVRSGRIDSARDFPIPAGGREARYGKSVTVHFTVGVDGVARDCVVAASGIDAEATALTCPLVIARIRFNPATNAAGDPVPARYGWRQDFFRRN